MPFTHTPVIFVIGYLMGLYKIIPPEGSVLTNVFGAIWVGGEHPAW